MRKTDHALHATLTLFTLGVWGIIWIIIFIRNRRYNEIYNKANGNRGRWVRGNHSFTPPFHTTQLESLKEISQKREALIRLFEYKGLEDLSPKELLKVTKIEERVDALQESVITRIEIEANRKSGYVYAVSNARSFGKDIIKIGMTLSEDPQKRIDGLNSASVPFNFDIHMLHYSEDANAAERKLHKIFTSRRVSPNIRKEYFYVTPEEVLSAAKKIDGLVVDFNEEFEAVKYIRSGKTIMKARGRKRTLKDNKEIIGEL